MRKVKSSVQNKCIDCGALFDFHASQLNHYKGAGRFCSRKCHYAYYRKNPFEHPCYKPGGSLDMAGYRVIRVLRNGKSQQIREHRYLMEQKIGRNLKRNEHVHHINGIKSDNRIKNLIILSASEHHTQHGHDKKVLEGAKKGREVLLRGWITWRKRNWAHGYSRCQSCGTNKIKHQGNGNCKKCYMRKYTNGNSESA